MSEERYLGINIDLDNDKNLQEAGMQLLSKFYLKEKEWSPQHAFARAATCYCFGDYNLAQRIYDYAAKGWFIPASPVLSNAVKINWPNPMKSAKAAKNMRKYADYSNWLKNICEENITALPISCFLNEVDDSIEGLNNNTIENRWLTVLGGGIGSAWSNIRSFHADISKGGKSPGLIPFVKTVDADMLAYRQGSTRRGSCAVYLDDKHPEVKEFIEMRVPTGDPNRRAFNLHHAVNLSSDFMIAAENNSPYNLVDPSSKRVVGTIDARDTFKKIVETRMRTGEPYCSFIDTANAAMNPYLKQKGLKIKGSNLCVSGDTKILTSNGYIEIQEVVNRQVEVWNGEEWSTVEVFKTGTNKRLMTLVTDSGYEIRCTPEHEFYIQEEYGKNPIKKQLKDLIVGDRLIKFNLPVIEGNKTLPLAYANGFYTGDGCQVGNVQRIYLYHDKRDLLHHFQGTMGKIYKQESQQRTLINCPGTLQDKFFVPDSAYDIVSRLNWFAGLCDSDGTIARNGSNESIQIGNVNLEFLKETQLMLQTLGVSSKIKPAAEEGYRSMPDGSGGLRDYYCQEAYRLLVSSTGLNQLKSLGFKTFRLNWTGDKPQRCAEQFIQVKSIIDNGDKEDTYCFTEPKRHMGMFNGILTGQCNEIWLPTTPDRTAVCCLSSVNLEKYLEWKDSQLIEDLVTFLDNVLEFFICKAPSELHRAVYSAERERSIGLGVFGFHSFLQSQNVALESAMAVSWNKKIFNDIKNKALISSKALGKARGIPEDIKASAMRNAHLLAVAPTSNIAIIAGTSPGIEPTVSNYYIHQTRAGNFPFKNKYLDKTLHDYQSTLNKPEGWVEETWQDILANDGSVQHLEWMDEYDREVFKTAFEIDQRWIVDLAADRQKFICQGQSLNLFFPYGSDINYVLHCHYRAWKKGCKGLYYLRTTAPSKRESVGSKVERIVLQDGENSDDCISCDG